ncbi:MAG: hypothetical protein AAFX58_13420 [Pseudomonadota bacterium]
MRTLMSVTAALLLIVTANGVLAGEAGKLEVRTVVQMERTVTNTAGETTTELVPVESVVPGEEVVYTVTYTNVSDGVTDNIVITNPIPRELTYVQGSAFGPGTEIAFSVDGGKTYASPEQLVIVDGALERPALPGDFTNIRWVVQNSLDAGSRGFARFRARLN